MRKDKVLIVEDEIKVSQILNMYFKKENYDTEVAYNGEEAINQFNAFQPDLIILDIMMPIKDGWTVAKEIREKSDVPIIIMTALSSENDVLKGYSLKVDDYVIKPINPRILIAKVANLIEKNKIKKGANAIIDLPPLHIDLNQRRLYINENEIKLSKTEFDLMVFFAQNNKKVCPRTLLLEKIWGESVYIDDRIIDTYVKNLRKLIKPYDFIQTVFGVGYRFEI